MKKRGINVALATLLLGTHALYANEAKDEKIKLSGYLKGWYQTMDHGGVNDKGLFRYDTDAAGLPNEWANFAAMITASGQASDHVDVVVSLQGSTTMGSEAVLGAVETSRGGFSNEGQGIGGSYGQPFWLHELDFTYKMGATHVKFGRQELNTPLAYTEKWNATANSFEAIVIKNTSIPKTTLQAMWISKGNGATDQLEEAPQVFGTEGQYYSYMGYDLDKDNYGVTDTNDSKGGAVVIGIDNHSIERMPVKAYYYNVPDAINAYWVQADLNLNDVISKGFKTSIQGIVAGIGSQGMVQDYLESNRTKNTTENKTGMTQAIAAKVSVGSGALSAYGAFSQTTEGNLPVANTATNYKKTNLPTASIFSDGMVAAQPNTTAYKVGVGYAVDPTFNLGVSYGGYLVKQNSGFAQVNQNLNGPAAMGFIANQLKKDIDLYEVDVVASKKYKEFSLAAMYIYVSNTYVPGAAGDANYGTYDNHIVRIVVSETF